MNPNFFNLKKRKKRDVLSELLSGSTSEGMVSKKELKALNNIIGAAPQATSEQSKKKQEPVKKTTTRGKIKRAKKKTTHYLSEEVFGDLDNLKNDIRSIVPDNLRSKISKSQIINQALILIMKEFETKGKKSRLVRDIIEKG